MTVDLYMAYMLMLMAMALTLMQGHSGLAAETISVELSRQLSKQETTNLLQW